MNKVILMGRLARDPEVRSTQSGKSVARMTIAVDRRVSRNAQPGQQTADFINLVAWERLADFCQNYLRKGTKILVEGRIQSRTYEGQDGQKKYAVEVSVSDIEFAESKSHDSSGGQFGGGQFGGAPAPAPMGQPPMMQGPQDSFGAPVSDDDIPF